jgi:glucose-6-phosphate isomerase
MKGLRFDFNNMFSFSVGARAGVTDQDLTRIIPRAAAAGRHLQKVIANQRSRVNVALEWVKLPFQNKSDIDAITRLGRGISRRYENVISLGIGGSYLGIRAAQDALCPAYYNEFPALRRGRPRIYFEGNNLDPDTLSILLQNLDPRKTFVVVISKSGETTETKAGFAVTERWLKKGVGAHYGRQIMAITDPRSGSLRQRVVQEQEKDPLSFRSLALMPGVGGRFSEFNMGLLHLAIAGVDIGEFFAGARAMYIRCTAENLLKNPASLYAALQTILYTHKGKSLAVMMPFAESLKSTADWYVQLLAESLGKKYRRKILISSEGLETWKSDLTRVVNEGRTPISSRGTNDLHSIQQNNIEGRNDKTVTFIRVEKFRTDIEVTGTGDFLSGRRYSELMKAAQEATEWALVRQQRPNCTILMPELSAYCWGQLLFFFEMATAFEGELLDVNAFDQPGVEGYKNYMYYTLRKPGLAQDIASEIKQNPLVKKKKYIL